MFPSPAGGPIPSLLCRERRILGCAAIRFVFTRTVVCVLAIFMPSSCALLLIVS